MLYAVCKQKKKDVLALAPLHSQRKAEGPKRWLMCSCLAKRCRGVGRGCGVNESMEEPTDGVRGTFLCVFNAVIHDINSVHLGGYQIPGDIWIVAIKLLQKTFEINRRKIIAWDVYGGFLQSREGGQKPL